jgi:DNA helicase HerA-like ATPase
MDSAPPKTFDRAADEAWRARFLSPQPAAPQPAPELARAAPVPTTESVPGYPPDRRGPAQPTERMIGRVVYCDGSRAMIATEAVNLDGARTDYWSVGKLLSINLGATRVVALVYAINTASESWSEDGHNVIQIKVEIVGEIYERPDGVSAFRRGVTNYPQIGSIAHRIRAADLKVMHDLGACATAAQIGSLSQDESIPAAVDVDMMLKRHFSVLGTTGVGKSSAVSLLLRRAVGVKPDLRVLILDPHNEYAAAFPDISITLDANSVELPFWILRFEEMADIVFRGRSASEEENEILRDMMAAARGRYLSAAQSNYALQSGLLKKPADAVSVSADTPVPYRMIDILQIIDEHLGKLDQRYNRYDLRNLKNRLEALHADPRYRFMFGRTAIEDNIAQVIGKIFRVPHQGKPITVFQLAGLPSDVVNAVASVLARMAFDLAMLSEGKYEILLLCEEAHRYVPQDRSLGFAPTRQAIARIAKEGRKYGCYMGVVTQRPGELDPTILSQCSTVFAMRLSNDRDQQIIRSAIADSSASTITFLSSIGNREAIAFGEGVATTMRMRFAEQPRHRLPAAFGHGGDGAGSSDLDLYAVVARMRGGVAA